MKFPMKKILAYSGLALLAIVVVFLVCRAMLNLDGLWAGFKAAVGSLRAIWIGVALAYLLYPVAHFMEQLCLRRHMRPKFARTISIAATVTVVLLIIFLFFYFIIPQLVINVPTLVQNLPDMIKQFMDSISAFLTSHGQSTEILTQLTQRASDYLNQWLNTDLMDTLSSLLTHAVSAAKGILNFIIGLIVMAYLLASKDQFVGQGKKILFAVCKKRRTATVILRHLRQINRIFSGFIAGKLLDSLVIGLISGVVLTILQIPYALVISIIVGCTNVIPVFGPFIGAIPSAFLLLLTSPTDCLIFLIFILILQQIDGNVIGPKILGDSTGLSAFWVLFALLLFNHLLGFWGMLLGVPVFASLYYLCGELISFLLRKKELPSATAEYVCILDIDQNGEISYLDSCNTAYVPKKKPSLFSRWPFGKSTAPEAHRDESTGAAPHLPSDPDQKTPPDGPN